MGGALLFIFLLTGFLFIHLGLGFLVIYLVYDNCEYELNPFWKLPIGIFWPAGLVLLSYGFIREWLEEVREWCEDK